MNKIQQAFSKSEEVWREHVVWTNFRILIVLRKIFLELQNTSTIKYSIAFNNNKMQLEVVVKIYKQIHTARASSLKSRYRTQIVDTSYGEDLHILNHTIIVMYNVNTLCLLVGYLWTSRNYEKVMRKMLRFLKLLFWCAWPTFGTSHNHPAQVPNWLSTCNRRMNNAWFWFKMTCMCQSMWCP